MSTHPFSSNVLNTALAALAGVAAAAVVKLLLDEGPEAARSSLPTLRPDPARRAAVRRAKLRELAEAAHDPLYLADMQAVNDDFAFVDAENI